MSLYCFGKIVPSRAARYLEECVPDADVARLHVRDIDPEDLATICEFGDLKRAGVTFRYVDTEDDSSATGIWLGASEIANRYSAVERSQFSTDYSNAMKATFLGGFIWNLLSCPHVEHGALALVDGGIEAIVVGTRRKCWQHFLTIIPKPWDTHDNPLYVWSHKVRITDQR